MIIGNIVAMRQHPTWVVLLFCITPLRGAKRTVSGQRYFGRHFPEIQLLARHKQPNKQRHAMRLAPQLRPVVDCDSTSAKPAQQQPASWLLLHAVARPVTTGAGIPTELSRSCFMRRMSILPFLKSAVSLALMSAAFCGWILLCVWMIKHIADSASLHQLITPAAVTAPSEIAPSQRVKITDQPRYTAMGWQTPSHWARQPTQTSHLSLDPLNPIVLATAIFLLSLLAMVLDAPEKDVERLLAIRPTADQRNPRGRNNS